MDRITKIQLKNGMGDAINARSFLIEYCNQLHIPQESITIYTDRHKVFFEGDKFILKNQNDVHIKLRWFYGFGHINIPKRTLEPDPELKISMSSGIKFSFNAIHEFNWKIPNIDHIKLPEKFVTVNFGYDAIASHDDICAKMWKLEYWNELVSKIGIPCVQIGGGFSCKSIEGTALNLVNKLSIKESAEVMKRALFHIDTEGGLPILNHHLHGKSVVLFGPTCMKYYGRPENLNLKKNPCIYKYCELNPQVSHGMYMNKNDLKCDIICMKDLTPDYVLEQIYKNKWL